MPRLMMRCGASPEISVPSNCIDPADGANVPDSMLKIVLLPEPFGPIRPRISPCSTLNDTWLTAVKPPNRFTKPSTTSTTVPYVAKRFRAKGYRLAPGKRVKQKTGASVLMMPSEPKAPGIVYLLL